MSLAKLLLARETENGATGRASRKAVGAALECWAESDFLRHATSEYVDFRPSPRSTIAAVFSPDGRHLASTHGDHTVKVTDVASGRLIHSLQGHRRTPWVVRFSPTDPDVMASGSLDFTAVVWRISTGQPIAKHDFGKPIASLAFDPSGMVLVVTAGHKLYSWQYAQTAVPVKILKTRRSLRALHFHPTAPHILLTAEVTERRAGPGGADGAGPVAVPLPPGAVAGLALVPRAASAGRAPGTAREGRAEGQSMHPQHAQQGGGGGSGGAAGDVSMDGPDPAPEEDPQDAVDELSAFIAAHNSSLGALPLRFFHQRHPQPQPQPPGRPQQQHANAGLGAGQGQGQAVVRHQAQASGAGGAGGGRAGNGAATGAGTGAAHPSVWSVVAPAAPVAHEAGAAAAGDGSHAHNEGAAAAAGAGGGGGAGAGGSGAALGLAAAWPMGLLRNLLTGVTGVISGAASSLGVGGAGGGAAAGGGGGGSDSVQAHVGAAGHAAGGGGGSGGVSMGGPGAVAGAGGAPSVTAVGGAAPGTGAADGGGPAQARAAGGGEANVVAAAAAVAGSRLSVLSPVDVIRHQSLGGGLRHAIPLVAPAVPPLPPPSLPPPLQHLRGSGPLTPAMQHLSLQNGGVAAQALQAHHHQAAPDGTHAPPDAYAVHMAAAAAAADAHVAPYELTWGWDHRAELGPDELERARQHAVVSTPDLPPAANHDTPCIVTVRLWEFRDPSRELRRELLVLPRVVLCSEMGVHISPCGRYMVCCVVRDSPSEACSQWQADQQAARHAAVDRAAAATRTHAARTEPSSPDGAAVATAVAPMQCDTEDGGDEAGDLRAADGHHAVVVGGQAAAAAPAATGDGDGGGGGSGGGAGICGVEAARVDSCRSVDMADAGPAGHEPSGSVQAMAGGCAAGPHGEPSVAWHGGGGSGGGGAGMEDAQMHDDTATQACCQEREAAAQPGASSAGPQGAVGCGAGAGLGVAAESGLAKLGKQPSGRRRRARGRGAGSGAGAGAGAGAGSSAGAGPAGPCGVHQLLVAQEEEGHPVEEGVGVGACEADGGRLGVAADGELEAGAGEASAAGPQHTVERAAARTAASRPGGDVGVGVGAGEYDSAGAAACRRMSAAAAASVSMSGPNPGSGQAAAAAAAQQAPDHHPRRHSHTHHHGHPHQQGQGQGETGSAAGAAAQGGAAPAGPSRPPLPPAAAPAAAGAPGSHQPQQLHSQQPEPLAAPQPQPPQQPQSPGEGATPHMFASIKEKLAQQRSLDEAAGARSVAVAEWAPAAPGAGAGAGAGAARGAHQAAAPLTEELSPVVCERAAADSGAAAATMPPHWAVPGREAGTPMGAAAAAGHAGGDAVTTAARPQAQPAATAAAQKASGHASGPFYELCIFYTGASPMAPSNAAPAMPTPTPSTSAASVAFPAAGSGAAASSRAAAAAATGAAAVGPHFGALLHARPVLAAHCMTSLQFSPTGRHVLVSYGRRHISLCSLVACAEQLAAVHSVVEVYSVPDMVLRRVLLSTEDEVNVAVFNAFPGGGMAYGTKEGRLRLLRYDRRPPLRSVIPFMPLPGSDSADGGAPRGADGAATGLAEDEDELDLGLDQALWNGAVPLAGTGDPHDGHPSFFTRFP